MSVYMQFSQTIGSKGQVFNLTVSAYRGADLLFTNTTTVRFNPRNVSTFIQTDKSRYQPGDTIIIRAASVQLDNRPYKGRVNISVEVRVPAPNKAERSWISGVYGWGGIVSWWELRLSLLSPAGSQRESCREVAIRGEPWDCVAGIQNVAVSTSWTMGSQSNNKCGGWKCFKNGIWFLLYSSTVSLPPFLF